MDHAGEELERGAKLHRRPVARADGQARKVSIMQSRILLRGYAREGEMPPSLATHPQNQQPKSTTKPKPTTKPRSFTQRTGHTPIASLSHLRLVLVAEPLPFRWCLS